MAIYDDGEDEEMSKSQTSIALAKRYLDDDPHLANFILRDLLEVKEAGLSDLAWAIHREGGSKNDVLYLIEQLEAYLEGKE